MKMYCRNCGTLISDNTQKFCSQCGCSIVANSNNNETEKTKMEKILEIIFEKYSFSLNSGYESNHGKELKNTIKKTNVYTALQIPPNEKIYFVADMTIFQQFKKNMKGFAIGIRGIYYTYGFRKTVAVMTWDEYLKTPMNIRPDSDFMSIGNINNIRKNEMEKVFKDLREYIQKSEDDLDEIRKQMDQNEIDYSVVIPQVLASYKFVQPMDEIRFNYGEEIQNTPEVNMLRQIFDMDFDEKIYYIESQSSNEFNVKFNGVIIGAKGLYCKSGKNSVNLIPWKHVRQSHPSLFNNQSIFGRIKIAGVEFWLKNKEVLLNMLFDIVDKAEKNYMLEEKPKSLENQHEMEMIRKVMKRVKLNKLPYCIHNNANRILDKEILINTKSSMGIPRDDDVYLICDINEGTAQKRKFFGFAICTSGLYFLIKGHEPMYFKWEKFGNVTIITYPELRIAGYEFEIGGYSMPIAYFLSMVKAIWNGPNIIEGLQNLGEADRKYSKISTTNDLIVYNRHYAKFYSSHIQKIFEAYQFGDSSRYYMNRGELIQDEKMQKMMEIIYNRPFYKYLFYDCEGRLNYEESEIKISQGDCGGFIITSFGLVGKDEYGEIQVFTWLDLAFIETNVKSNGIECVDNDRTLFIEANREADRIKILSILTDIQNQLIFEDEEEEEIEDTEEETEEEI